MAVDILSVNALHRTTANNRKELKVQQALRDSAIAAQGNTQTYIDSWAAVITGLDSDITNFVSNFDYMDSFHLYWNNNDHYNVGNYSAFKCGIKRLCDYTAEVGTSITGHFGVVNNNGSQLQCGCNCSFSIPAGVTRLGITGTAPGGPEKMYNCCGGGHGGPYGSFISAVLCVVPGDQFQFCAGCSYCCFPYCCGQPLYTSDPSYMCITATGSGSAFTNGDRICLRSPNPYACVEMKNRGRHTYTRCGHQQMTNGGYTNCVFGGGCCCWTSYYGLCMCNECGSSICNNGNNRGCIYFGCASQNAHSQNQDYCLGGSHFQCDLYGTDGCQACCCGEPGTNYNTQCRNAIFICPNIKAAMTPGSCFPWWGGWPGGWSCENCHTTYHPNHPYGLAVGIQTSNCEINHCMNQCCPSCICKANGNNRCFPGYGGYSGMVCGGSIATSDMGRHGAWCVQYC